VIAIVRYAMRESLRRRVFAVVLVLTLAFLVLYAVGAHFAFKEANGFAAPRAVDPVAFTGATLFGLAMFAILFLGSVLAAFLTLGVVRGDAESGLLQPLVVRPVGRSAMLGARFAGAAAVSFAYVVVVFAAALAITGASGDWFPDHVLGPATGLGLAVVTVAAISVLASVYLSGTAQGIAVFMVFGAGLTAGLLGQIGDALNSATLESIAHYSTWALPFEALYQAGLHALISETGGLTNAILRLGPFGGAEAAGPGLGAYAAAYCALALGLAALAFSHRDL
jgi:ABC-type transport system involved in multi-copper enzyme maturation permease subunit